ncbi:MAG: hypothetical protein HXK70_04500 [Clostridiales bacterium]|nr:hypothetical protein [Clostridiales bacterium]
MKIGKVTSQTTSLITSAVQMGIERNLKILIVDGSFKGEMMKKAFLQDESNNELIKKINMGKVDISAGLEGLLAAVASNKISPETVKSYSTPILVGRVDIIYGLKTIDKKVFENSLMPMLEMVKIANMYYDLIFIDLQKGERTSPAINEILKASDLVIYTMEQKLEQINKFMNLWGIDEALMNKNRVIPLLTREDSFSKYNCDNIARKIGMKPGMPSIVYNTLLMEAIQEGKLVNLLITLNDDNSSYRNNYLIKTVEDLNLLIIDRIQQLKYEKR